MTFSRETRNTINQSIDRSLPQIIFRKVADLKHEQELEEMQQNQPQQEFSQDHIVRRLISKFRKPSDAGAIALQPLGGSGNTLQVPPAHGAPNIPTISGQVAAGLAGDPKTAAGEGGGGGGAQAAGSRAATSSIARSLAGKSRWSQLVASAAAGAASATRPAAPSGPAPTGRQLLDVDSTQMSGESSSNRSSADGGRDDEVDENYFRPGGKGHQALLDNMDKR